MIIAATVFQIYADHPEAIYAGETLLLRFRVELSDLEVGSITGLQIGFVVKQNTSALINAIAPIDIDEQSESAIAGTLTISTLPLVPYVNAKDLELGWYATDGVNVSYSPRRKVRVREAIALPLADLSLILTATLVLPSPQISAVITLTNVLQISGGFVLPVPVVSGQVDVAIASTSNFALPAPELSGVMQISSEAIASFALPVPILNGVLQVAVAGTVLATGNFVLPTPELTGSLNVAIASNSGFSPPLPVLSGTMNLEAAYSPSLDFSDSRNSQYLVAR